MTQESKPPVVDGLHPVVEEELGHLSRVQQHLVDAQPPPPSESDARAGRASAAAGTTGQLHFDDDLIELRDEVIDAKAEDVAPLAEQMMRVAAIRAARGSGGRGDAPADPESPYFGHLRLREGAQDRDVFIGKRTYINTGAGVVIVDWRNAPISSLYYRYEEGDDYDEEIAGRRREGLVTARRTLSVVDGALRRVSAPQGIFVREPDGDFRKMDDELSRLHGGQGTALRPKGPAFVSHRSRAPKPGRKARPGVRPDKHLPEISALLDPEQFRLITAEAGGLVVITGGAGSGKTTIGLHRIAFLAFQRPKQYRPERMMVLVPGRALQHYISRVLPDLGLPGVPVRTVADWLLKQRKRTFRHLRIESSEETEPAVSSLKKHPDLLAAVDELADEYRKHIRGALATAVQGLERGDLVLDAWARVQDAPVAQQLRGLLEWCRKPLGRAEPRLPKATLGAVEAVVSREAPGPRELLGLWADLLTDRERLARLGRTHGPVPSSSQVEAVVSHCARQTSAVFDAMEAREHGERPGRSDEERAPLVDGPDDSVVQAYLSPEDDALLLRLYQRFCGELTGRTGRRLTYAHLLVDEVQDLSVVELAVVLRTAAQDGSVTLAGDPAQRMVFDTGYADWPELLQALGLDAVAIEPLRIGYRSTAEIQQFAQAILGPHWASGAPRASRAGVPVEAFHFGDPGEAVVFLADALRELVNQEPMASVALIARYPAQAETYYRALRGAEVPGLRRVLEQDFSFTPGIEITDVRQVKGLEFDYVVLLDVTAESYPNHQESRHLIHIAATRAAHQLWLVVPGRPSRVLDDIAPV